MNFPIRSKRSLAAALSLALLAGCSSAGLSPRETQRQNYSSFVYSLYDLPATEPGAQDGAPRAPAKLVLPARVAVAQVGEVAPPQAFMEKLRSRPELFSRVEGISGIAGSYGISADEVAGRYARRRADCPPGTNYVTVGAAARQAAESEGREQVQSDVAKMQRLARDMGMDHLILVGGTIDHAVHGNALSILDLTIVGAFVVPSKQIDAKATAAGAIIDLNSGRVVLTASADASKGGLAATATQEGGQLAVLRQARDEVVGKLADSLLAECQRRQVAGLASR
jgi:hypothetical protein